MKLLWISLIALLPLAASAADLLDWSKVQPGTLQGVYVDGKDSKVELAQVEGPAAGQKAIRVSSNLVQWGGMWAGIRGQDLSKAGGLRFKAKSAAPGQFVVSLTSANKAVVDATVRVLGGDWQDFELPMSAFAKTRSPDPAAPKDVVFDPAKLEGFNLRPSSSGKSELTVGPVGIVAGKAVLKTGLMQSEQKKGQTLAQDFEALETGAYGSYADDKGSKIEMSTQADGPGGKVGVLKYELKDGGWCGVWMRAGDDWLGQDWSGAKSLTLRVQSAEPVQLELAFNDANQVSYTSLAAATSGAGWQDVTVAFSSFAVNPYYQPPQAKKGSAQDLTHVESVNIAVKTVGKGSVKIDDVVVKK